MPTYGPLWALWTPYGLPQGISSESGARSTRRECDEPEMIAFFQSVEELLAKEFGFVSEQKARAA
jgi:hypothetical protein